LGLGAAVIASMAVMVRTGHEAKKRKRT